MKTRNIKEYLIDNGEIRDVLTQYLREKGIRANPEDIHLGYSSDGVGIVAVARKDVTD